MLSCVRLCVTPWTVARQAPLSLGFSRQEHWVAIPFSRGSLWARDQTWSLLHCRQILYCLSYQGSPNNSPHPLRKGSAFLYLSFWIHKAEKSSCVTGLLEGLNVLFLEKAFRTVPRRKSVAHTTCGVLIFSVSHIPPAIQTACLKNGSSNI